jgi:hypothetical protein
VTLNSTGVEAGKTQPAFYTRTGSMAGDLLALLHPPYTAWHLSYVVFGACLAAELDLVRLGGTLAAFFFGTGIAAHALDEWFSRPMGTRLGGRVLLELGVGGLAASAAIAVGGVFVVSLWTLAWAAAGIFLVLAYTLEWHRLLHSDIMFGLAWGAFPVLVGYWAQTEEFGAAAILVAAAATLLSLAQRALSRPARYLRRNAGDGRAVIEASTGEEVWTRDRLLATWESPLKFLAAAVVVLAAGLVLMRM